MSVNLLELKKQWRREESGYSGDNYVSNIHVTLLKDQFEAFLRNTGSISQPKAALFPSNPLTSWRTASSVKTGRENHWCWDQILYISAVWRHFVRLCGAAGGGSVLHVYTQRRRSRRVLSSEDACWVDTEQQHVETGRPGVHQHQEKW